MLVTIHNFIYDRSWKKRKEIINWFPLSLKKDVISVLWLIKIDKYSIHGEKIEVTIDDEILYIPSRIYFNKIPIWKLQSLTEQQKIILACIYSRHHNWYIREEMLRELNWNTSNFTIPYVVQLLSEYVIELFPIINEQINESNISEYNKFYRSNQSYFKKIEQRIMSYWEVYYWYYRGCKRADYIWFQILNRIKFYSNNKF